MGRLLSCLLVAVLCCVNSATSVAWAQPEGDDEAAVDKDESASGDESGSDKDDSDKDKDKDKDEDGDEDKGKAGEDEGDSLDPSEDPRVGYHFLGMRFRDFIVPKFILNIFADGGATTNAFTFGPEYVYRRDNLQYAIAASYGDFSMDPILFKGWDDNDAAYERVWSSLKVIWVTFDLQYEIPIKKGMFAVLIGAGVGIGGVFGDLNRHQVYPLAGNDPANPSTDDLGQWGDCTGPNSPDVRLDANSPYCDEDNEHYPTNGEPYSEPSWANGGSKPFIFPYLSIPQISFRFKPIKHLNTRFDFGFSITGFYLGMAAHYGFGGPSAEDDGKDGEEPKEESRLRLSPSF